MSGFYSPSCFLWASSFTYIEFSFLTCQRERVIIWIISKWLTSLKLCWLLSLCSSICSNIRKNIKAAIILVRVLQRNKTRVYVYIYILYFISYIILYLHIIISHSYIFSILNISIHFCYKIKIYIHTYI